jgi:rubrerythrin
MTSKGAERIQKTVDTLRSWQKLEREAIETTAQIMEETENSLIRQVMEIIRNDSVQHHRVQQFIIDVMTKAPVTMQAGDMADVWSKLEEHDKLEKEVIGIATKLKEDCPDPVAKLLIGYLLQDEEKHESLLEQLDELKRHMSKLA